MIGACGRAADLPGHLESVPVGQAEVEQDEVGVAAGRLGQPLARRGRLDHLVAVGAQGGPQEPAHLRLVLDQQHHRAGRRHEAAPTRARGRAGTAGPSAGG